MSRVSRGKPHRPYPVTQERVRAMCVCWMCVCCDAGAGTGDVCLRTDLPPVHNLICVLDWGLGHASRSLALAARLEAAGQRVSWASSGPAAELLRRELPGRTVHELPPYVVRYPTGNMVWNVATQLPRWLSTIRAEHRTLARLADRLRPDRIISDSRFGCYHPEVTSVFLTHQLHPITGFPPAEWLYRRYLTAHYREFWVPDEPAPDRTRGLLSGQLSATAGYPEVTFLGPLSKLGSCGRAQSDERFDVLLLLSGPEPARTKFEAGQIARFAATNQRVALVRGLPAHTAAPAIPDHWSLWNYAGSGQLRNLILSSDRIVCRPGYSTLMDLHQLGRLDRSVELHPTPGQTEQLYLSGWVKNNFQ